MSKEISVKNMENRTKDNQIVFFKSQEEFAKALRESAGTVEDNGFTDELVEE